MKVPGKDFWATFVTLTLIAACACAAGLKSLMPASADNGPLRACIRLPEDSNRLLHGYNRQLLDLLAEYMERDSETELLEYQGVCLSDLSSDSTDIEVLPLKDSLAISGEFVIFPVDSVCLWAIKKSQKKFAGKVAAFLDSYMKSDGYAEMHDIFLKTYDPFGEKGRKRLSPYDDIIKSVADSAGYDWRLLAAIIYQESKFHIEAVSKRGATGLMQIIPATGRAYGAEDLYDPEQNIAAGTRYIRHLGKRFRRIGANPEERTKLTLAAYNAGEGRIMDCITVARARNLNPGYWENLASVIPSMRSRSAEDSIELRCGTFQGYETLAYVDRVLAIYDEFRRICPEQ